MEQSRILKKFPARLGEVAREKAIDVGKIEIWFQDEARIGQKSKITRRWQARHSPERCAGSATASTYIFGAICPKLGKGAALILPSNLHLAEIARTVAPGAHAVLLVDQAGWHLSPPKFYPVLSSPRLLDLPGWAVVATGAGAEPSA
jgi:putative transposase